MNDSLKIELKRLSRDYEVWQLTRDCWFAVARLKQVFEAGTVQHMIFGEDLQMGRISVIEFPVETKKEASA